MLQRLGRGLVGQLNLLDLFIILIYILAENDEPDRLQPLPIDSEQKQIPGLGGDSTQVLGDRIMSNPNGRTPVRVPIPATLCHR